MTKWSPSDAVRAMKALGLRSLTSENPVCLYDWQPPETPKSKTRPPAPSPPAQAPHPPTPYGGGGGGHGEVEGLEAIQTIEALEQAVRAFDACDLKHLATNTVFARGNPKARLMFVGEAPGNDEDLQGMPFVGKSGQLLDEALAYGGFDVEKDCYITNMVFWRPPGNRNPTPHELELCLPFVRRHIVLVNPLILVFVGGVAAKTLLQTTTGITVLRQGWHDYQVDATTASIVTKALFHPAYLLRAARQKRYFWQDILAIREKYLALTKS